MKKRIVKINFERNRVNKIARNKKKRKNKKYNYNKNYFLQSNKNKQEIKTKVQKILEKNEFSKKIDIIYKKAIIKIPKEFCFIRNPEQSLEILKKINYFFERIDRNLKNLLSRSKIILILCKFGE